MSDASTRQSTWPLRPLGVATKIAIVSAIAMMIFAEVTPVATRHILNWFVGYMPQPLEPDHVSDLFVKLLRDGFTPDVQDELDELVEVNTGMGFANFVLDADGEVAWRSPDLALCPDEVLAKQAAFFVLTIDEEPVATASVRYRAVAADGAHLGYGARIWLLPLSEDGSYGDAEVLPLVADTRLVRGMVESDRHVEWSRRADHVVGVAISILMALVIGIPASWLVSRRIRGLAREASGQTDSLPGPFTVHSRDEIGELAMTLNAMRGRVLELMTSLTTRDEKRRQWLAQVSHDIRTPLTSALVRLERAQATLAAGDTAEGRRCLDDARQDIRRLGDFADDLFELSRLELDPLKLEPVLPNELIASAARSVQPQARRKGITIESEGEPDLAPLHADGHRLMRACENLLTNAVRYATRDVRISARATEGGAAFAVVDDGPGFPGEGLDVDLDRARQQADSTGLGLVVVQRVAEAHGGHVEARNEPTGTRVTLVIPRGTENGRAVES